MGQPEPDYQLSMFRIRSPGPSESVSQPYSLAVGRPVHFLQMLVHFLQMLAAMMVGMIALGLPHHGRVATDRVEPETARHGG